MEIRLKTEPILDLQMKDTAESWALLKTGIGKLSLYEMRKCGMTSNEMRVLSEFHTELQRLLLVSGKN